MFHSYVHYIVLTLFISSYLHLKFEKSILGSFKLNKFVIELIADISTHPFLIGI